MKSFRILVLSLLLLPILGFGASYTTKQYTEIHGKGLKRSSQFKEWVEKHSAYRHQRSDAQIPSAIDLSPRVSPPENQGSHGSCWDFGIIKALRSAWMLVGKDPGRLSFNYLICGGHTNYSCDSGGDFDAMDAVIGGKGPWLAVNDPYPNCSGRCVTGQPMAATGKTIVQVGAEKPSFELLGQAVAADHMMTIDVAAGGDWMNYSSGIFDSDQYGPNDIDHIINLVGYNCQTSVTADGKYCVFDANGKPVNGDGYLILMNNWGTNWGIQGYMWTRWAVDAAADTAMYFTVDYTPIPVPVPTPTPTPVPSQAGFPLWAWLAIVVGIVAVGGVVFVVVKKK